MFDNDFHFDGVDGPKTNDLSKTIALILFCLFLFFLPLYEAPKNIFSVLFVFFWRMDSLQS